MGKQIRLLQLLQKRFWHEDAIFHASRPETVPSSFHKSSFIYRPPVQLMKDGRKISYLYDILYDEPKKMQSSLTNLSTQDIYLAPIIFNAYAGAFQQINAEGTFYVEYNNGWTLPITIVTNLDAIHKRSLKFT